MEQNYHTRNTGERSFRERLEDFSTEELLQFREEMIADIADAEENLFSVNDVLARRGELPPFDGDEE